MNNYVLAFLSLLTYFALNAWMPAASGAVVSGHLQPEHLLAKIFPLGSTITKIFEEKVTFPSDLFEILQRHSPQRMASAHGEYETGGLATGIVGGYGFCVGTAQLSASSNLDCCDSQKALGVDTKCVGVNARKFITFDDPVTTVCKPVDQMYANAEGFYSLFYNDTSVWTNADRLVLECRGGGACTGSGTCVTIAEPHETNLVYRIQVIVTLLCGLPSYRISSSPSLTGFSRQGVYIRRRIRRRGINTEFRSIAPGAAGCMAARNCCVQRMVILTGCGSCIPKPSCPSFACQNIVI